MSLYNEKNYTIDVPYIFNHYIREYDIAQANINILFSKGVINDYLYNQLSNSDRMIRQVYIGKMIRDNPEIQNILSEGVIEAKQKLFLENEIPDNRILSIKNDAVFIIGMIPKHTEFGNVRFVHKNTYTSFMKLYSMEVYYGAGMNYEVIDVKGIKDSDLELYHQDFLGIIIDYFRYLQKEGAEAAFHYITYIINEYVGRKLPINTYRRFRYSNDFVINGFTEDYGILQIEDNEYNRNAIDISYNLGLLRIMHTYVSQVLYEEKVRS